MHIASVSLLQALDTYGEKLLTSDPNITTAHTHFLHETGNTPSLRAAAMDQWLFGLADFHVRQPASLRKDCRPMDQVLQNGDTPFAAGSGDGPVAVRSSPLFCKRTCILVRKHLPCNSHCSRTTSLRTWQSISSPLAWPHRMHASSQPAGEALISCNHRHTTRHCWPSVNATSLQPCRLLCELRAPQNSRH